MFTEDCGCSHFLLELPCRSLSERFDYAIAIENKDVSKKSYLSCTNHVHVCLTTIATVAATVLCFQLHL